MNYNLIMKMMITISFLVIATNSCNRRGVDTSGRESDTPLKGGESRITPSEHRRTRSRERDIASTKTAISYAKELNDFTTNSDPRSADEAMSKFVRLWKPVGKTKQELMSVMGSPFFQNETMITYAYSRVIVYRWDFILDGDVIVKVERTEGEG